MGGILAVNRGSNDPPTFSILEWKPTKANNKKPIILVGKGIVYDTGGVSLKPTANSMDFMKSDMGGAATVIGSMVAIAANKLPLHVIALVPSTDNRPGQDAYVPGDVIEMFSGDTVEVLNTDAEGRLVLADALHYAKKYQPELVIDFATLTGAAARAIGPEGISYMSTADDTICEKMEKSGFNVYERLVRFPLWREYRNQLKSNIADIKNLGGPSAGMITAGKFLEHFIDFPWLHFDIAGSAYLKVADGYRTKEGTGVGVRLVYDFLKNY
jgi:leucyl aminopeptidase